MYTRLTETLDARTVAAHMYQRNALTLKELQSIQSLRDRPVEAAESLLNIIMQQPDAVYLCFLDVLKHTEQLHIYRTIVECGYKGKQCCCSYAPPYSSAARWGHSEILRSVHLFICVFYVSGSKTAHFIGIWLLEH